MFNLSASSSAVGLKQDIPVTEEFAKRVKLPRWTESETEAQLDGAKLPKLLGATRGHHDAFLASTVSINMQQPGLGWNARVTNNYLVDSEEWSERCHGNAHRYSGRNLARTAKEHGKCLGVALSTKTGYGLLRGARKCELTSTI